jgi:hypothetical protein
MKAIHNPLAQPGGDPGGPPQVVSDAPDNGPEGPPAIQGKAGDEIEETQAHVDLRNPPGQCVKLWADWQDHQPQQPEQPGDAQAGHRTG